MITKDVKALEYPRHVHKPHEAFLLVHSAEECEKALADGWQLTPVLDRPGQVDDGLKHPHPPKH